MEGKGKLYHTNGNIDFVGSFKANKPDGEGISYSETTKDKVLYKGVFSKGKYHGKGTWYGEEKTYIGEFKFGKRNG